MPSNDPSPAGSGELPFGGEEDGWFVSQFPPGRYPEQGRAREPREGDQHPGPRLGAPPAELLPLRDEGLALLRRLHGPDRLAVHWGMCMAAYPFFGAVAETVGRLLRLQGTITAAQAQRRIRERLGERETVARAARRILRCFHDGGVLEETGSKGVYQGTPARRVDDPGLAAWLIEAALIAGGAEASPLRALLGTPALFPFELQPVRAGQLNGRLEVFRQGLDEDVVALKRYAWRTAGYAGGR